jgi:hypothetical protein
VPEPVSVGVISNPASRRNARGGLKTIEAELAAHPQVSHRLARTPPQIDTALAELAAAGVRRVVLNGGDGTVQAALTTLALRSPFASPPQVLVLAGGTTNMSAYDLGSHGRPVAQLRALLGGRLRTTRRRVLAVREDDGPLRLFSHRWRSAAGGARLPGLSRAKPPARHAQRARHRDMDRRSPGAPARRPGTLCIQATRRAGR